MFLNLSYITRPILTLFIHFDLHQFFHNAEYFFLFLMMLLISSLRPYPNNILLYNVYSFDTMEFSIKK